MMRNFHKQRKNPDDSWESHQTLVTPSATYLILTNDTQQVIAHSTVRPFDEDHPNQRLDSLQDEGSTGLSTEESSEQQDIGNLDNESIHLSATDSEDRLLVSTNDILSQRALVVNPTDLIGLSIVANKDDGGTEKAMVTRKLND